MKFSLSLVLQPAAVISASSLLQGNENRSGSNNTELVQLIPTTNASGNTTRLARGSARATMLSEHRNLSKTLSKRGDAGDIDLIVPLGSSDFLNWDVAMSSVIHAKDAEARVTIESGQQIANSIKTGADMGLVSDFLTLNVSIDYTNTTTSTVSGSVQFLIPKGNYGAIVSNPNTHREFGAVWTGQPGKASVEDYQADSYEDKTYNLDGGALTWVKGLITTCTGDSYPLPRCLGEGSLE